MFSHSAGMLFVSAGGEGATAREVLRHQSVEKVVMVDIDKVCECGGGEGCTAVRQTYVCSCKLMQRVLHAHNPSQSAAASVLAAQGTCVLPEHWISWCHQHQPSGFKSMLCRLLMHTRLHGADAG